MYCRRVLALTVKGFHTFVLLAVDFALLDGTWHIVDVLSRLFYAQEGCDVP